jgi:hypothetical protein
LTPAPDFAASSCTIFVTPLPNFVQVNSSPE